MFDITASIVTYKTNKEELKKIGVDYYYYFNKNKQFDETEL